jgi:hypothetical protein
VWRKVRYDKPLGKLATDAVTPGQNPAGTPSGSPSPSPSPSSKPSTPSDGSGAAARKQAAQEAGLCA